MNLPPSVHFHSSPTSVYHTPPFITHRCQPPTSLHHPPLSHHPPPFSTHLCPPPTSPTARYYQHPQHTPAPTTHTHTHSSPMCWQGGVGSAAPVADEDSREVQLERGHSQQSDWPSSVSPHLPNLPLHDCVHVHVHSLYPSQSMRYIMHNRVSNIQCITVVFEVVITFR